MLLTIDIGNTTVAVGGFLGPELRFVRRLPSDRNMDAAACAARAMPSRSPAMSCRAALTSVTS